MFDNYNNNENSNSLFNINNGFNDINENGDVPPKLEPIKNLSEATASSAPTMDVLSPMNIMPESFSNSIDKLDAYENGSNFQNIQPQNQDNYGQINIPISNEYSLMKENIPDVLNNTLQQNNDISFGILNNDVTSLLAPTLQNENSNLIQEQQDNSLNTMENILVQNNNPDFDITNNKNIDETTPIMESQISNMNQENENKYDLSNIPLTGSLNLATDFSSINLGIDKEPGNFNSNDNFDTGVEIGTYQNALEEENIPTQTEDYTILQDNIEEPQLDLVINNEFDSNFDTLDILDIEDASKNDDNITQVEVDSESTLITNIEKIKELISQIKNTGVEISLEEFDFESMYQLIIKINK